LACWVIGYGVIQSLAPVLIQRFGAGGVPKSKTVQFWTSLLTVVPAAIAIALQVGIPTTMTVVVGLMVFGVVFAFNSAVHSYLVLAFTDDDKVALNVGFYYMANSGGRLAGTVLSGFIYQFYGLVGCLWVSTALVLAAAMITRKLPDPQPTKEIDWKVPGGD
jgi:MFS family permease